MNDVNLVSKTFQIQNARGLHARPASKLVQIASSFPCEVYIEAGSERVNAKSVMGVLLLCAGCGSSLTLSARGPGAEECLKALGDLIQSGFGEQ